MGFLFSTIHSRAGCTVENGEHDCGVEHSDNGETQREGVSVELSAWQHKWGW